MYNRGVGGRVAGELYNRTFSTLPVPFVFKSIFSACLSIPLSHWAHLR